MFSGFKIDCVNEDENTWSQAHYECIGRGHEAGLRGVVEKSLEQYISSHTSLDAGKIEQDWFPSFHADVFISHSHTDEVIAHKLAGYLSQELNLTVFLDSSVWGYSNDLLKKIDDEYCFSEESGMYNYNKRNVSTSHVHMLLASALMKMIRKSESVIFLNTRNSFLPAVNNNMPKDDETVGVTKSPWIFYEHLLIENIKSDIPERFKLKSLEKSKVHLEYSMDALALNDRNIDIDYSINLSKLIDLNSHLIEEWVQLYKRSRPTPSNSLDCLYKITNFLTTRKNLMEHA